MASDDGATDMTGWADEDIEHLHEMKRLRIEAEWWSPTPALRSKQKKEKKRLELRGIRAHNKCAIAAAILLHGSILVRVHWQDHQGTPFGCTRNGRGQGLKDRFPRIGVAVLVLLPVERKGERTQMVLRRA